MEKELLMLVACVIALSEVCVGLEKLYLLIGICVFCCCQIESVVKMCSLHICDYFQLLDPV